MGSRYDILVLANTTLEQFTAALQGGFALGEQTTPWSDQKSTAVAQIGPHVAVAAPPGRMPWGVGTGLSRELGVEAAKATVWDSVSSYALSVVGPDADRSLSYEGQDENPQLHERGDRLPEEPRWELDESYVQAVIKGRYGIDPGYLPTDETWFALLPVED